MPTEKRIREIVRSEMSIILNNQTLHWKTDPKSLSRTRLRDSLSRRVKEWAKEVVRSGSALYTNSKVNDE